MLGVGIGVYAVASSELVSQHITVASYNHSATSNGAYAGRPLAGPFTALAEINAISNHLRQSSQLATGGTQDPATGVVTGGDDAVTYGTAPSINLDGQGNCLSAVGLWTDPAGFGTVQCAKGGPLQITGSIDPNAIAGLRSTLTTGSFLISSLFVSVVAFGVAALTMGLGVVLLLIAVVVLNLTNRIYPRPGKVGGAAPAPATA